MTTENTTADQRQPLMTLTVQQHEQGQVDSRTAIGWCLSPQLISEIRTRGFERPKLLLVIRHVGSVNEDGEPVADYTETGYVVVPLAQGMTFVNFRRPGVNEVIPIIVDAAGNDSDGTSVTTRLRNIRLGRVGRLLDDDGSDRLSYCSNLSGIRYIFGGFTLRAIVDKKMFAREPSQWMQTVIGRFFPKWRTDQCSYRKHAFCSLVWLVPFMALGTLFKIAALLIGLVVTKRKLNPSHLLHPFAGQWWGPLEDTPDNDTFFWHTRGGSLRPWPFRVFNHLVALAGATILWRLPFSHLPWWQCLVVVSIGLFGAAALIGIGWLVVTGVGSGLSSLLEMYQRHSKSGQQTAEQEHRATMLTQLNGMVCDSSRSAPTSLDQLPPGKRTIVLRFASLKTKVCRPYADR